MLFGHVVGFVPRSALPQKHQDFKWVLASYVPFCGSNARKPRLGPLEATALLLGAKLGDLEGKFGYREVMLKLSRAMLCHVEAICQILFGHVDHVVGFASCGIRPRCLQTCVAVIQVVALEMH